MKSYKIFLILIAGIISFVSCTKEDTSPVLTTVDASIVENLPSSSYQLTEPITGDNPLAFTLTWTETTFGLDNNSTPSPIGPVTYSIEIDRAGNNFASPQTLAGTTTLSANIFVKQLNTSLTENLGAKTETKVDIEVRVVAFYGANAIGKAYSTNALPLSVTTYEPTADAEPVYIVGDMNGWDNKNTDFALFRNTNDPKNRDYTYTGKFAAGTTFKFMPKKSLGTNKMYSKLDETNMSYSDTPDGKFTIDVEGFKTITLNTKTLVYSIVDYDASKAKSYITLGPIGTFCAWDNEPPMTQSTYDTHQWKLTYTFDASTAVKFRGNKDWVNNWGGKPEEMPFGHGVFDGAGADVLPGTYTIYFNDLTGHYLIQK